MQYGNVAEAYDPFRTLLELSEIEPVYNSYHSISSPGAHNGSKRWIVEHHLHVFYPLFVCSAKAEISFTDCVTNFYFKSPRHHLLYRRFDVFSRNITGRRCNANGVPMFEITGNYRNKRSVFRSRDRCGQGTKTNN